MTPLSRPFQIAALFEEHPQSYLKFDMLTGIGQVITEEESPS
ncbi:MAG: hypothetical protein V8T12_02285 [Parabacteroides johnsonii]